MLILPTGILLVTGETLMRPELTDKLIPIDGGPGRTTLLNVVAEKIRFIDPRTRMLLASTSRTVRLLLLPMCVMLTESYAGYSRCIIRMVNDLCDRLCPIREVSECELGPTMLCSLPVAGISRKAKLLHPVIVL